MRLFIFSVLCPFLTVRGADPLPGHSSHGEVFNEGPRQAAVLIPGCGDAVKFPISSKNAEAQKFFNQGVGQLHGFWYYEAERSFRQVAALDPDCAMAYWGMSMANVNNDKRATAFIKKAAPLKAKATPREQKWISVLENLYRDKDKRDKKQKSLDCIKDFETLVQDDPKDIEAKAFLVWRIWFSRDEAPISSAQAVDALLDQIFAVAPNHPAHHYRIHLWDQSKPARALTSAAQCGQSAPGIAHMWHMPGHTFSKLQRTDDAAWQQEASTRVDHAYMIRSFILPDQIHNYAHNEEWLVRTFNDLGRVKDAIGLAKSLIANPRHPAVNMLDKASTSASYGRTRLIETYARWELWDALNDFTVAPVGHPAHDIIRLRARGVAAYHLKNATTLAAALKELESVTLDSEKKQQTKKDTAEKPEAKKQEGKQAEKPSVKARKSAVAELKVLIALLDSKSVKSTVAPLIDALKDSDTPKDSIARYWLKLDEKSKAAEHIQKIPRDLAGLAAKTELLQACGKTDEAKRAFEDVRKLAFAMDRDLPVAKRLDSLAKVFGVKGDWPSAAPKRSDSGVRPALSSLGPMHWHPPVAPVFEALTLDNKRVESSEFTKKKPTIFMFYLGHECGHCVEQIQAFSKAEADFAKAGIQLVAVTIEPTQVAGKIRDSLKLAKDQPMSFPILCDSSLNAFKKVRAYDDFESEALHATILIDASGHQRWQDISYIPFTDTKFLLREATRLLAIPAADGSQ